MPFFSGVTDAIGLTDYSGAESARRASNRALGGLSGASKELIDWWKLNSAPYQQGLMTRGTELYESATPTGAGVSRALGEASADVTGAYGRAREATARGLGRYGVPSSGRFGSAMTGLGHEQAAAEAMARNQARAGLRDKEFSQKSSALGLQSSLNAPNYGLVGTGMGGLGTAASGYGNVAAGLEASNQGAIGGLIQGVGYALGRADGGEVRKYANGGKVRGLSIPPRYRTEARGLSAPKWGYADGMEVRERFMGDADRVAPRGLEMPRQLRGEMRGPGTPISDSIPVQTDGGEEARLADGEVVVPTDSVAAMGLQLFQQDPERAAHMLGVALLEEQIDQTHTPAEVQEQRGLSVNPRRNMGGLEMVGRPEAMPRRGMGGLEMTQPGMMAGRGMGQNGERYANGGPVGGLRVPRRDEYDDYEDEQERPRPTMGTGLAERGARTLEDERRRKEEILSRIMSEGYADGGQARGLRDPRDVKKKYEEEQDRRPSLGTGLAEGAAQTLDKEKKRQEARIREIMYGYADGGPVGGLQIPKKYADGDTSSTSSPWDTGLSMLGHGLANAYSRGGWLQGLQAGQKEGRLEAADLEAQQTAQREQEKRKNLAELTGQYGISEAGAQPSIIDKMAAQDIDYAAKFAKLKGIGGDGTEYGVNPVYTTDDKGNVALLQLSKTGDPRRVNLPEGLRVTRPLNWVDLGNKRVGLDPITGRPVQQYDINLGPTDKLDYKGDVKTAETIARETAEAKVKAAQALPQAEASANELVSQLDKLVAHPGLGTAVGASSLLPVVPGTSQADFVTLLDQIGGSQFLQAFTNLKGGGAITEIEGKKAEAAIARMSRKQSEEEFRKSAKDFRDIIIKGIERQRKAAGVQQEAPGQVTNERPAEKKQRLRYNPATGEFE